MYNVELTVLFKVGHATFALQMWEGWFGWGLVDVS